MSKSEMERYERFWTRERVENVISKFDDGVSPISIQLRLKSHGFDYRYDSIDNILKMLESKGYSTRELSSLEKCLRTRSPRMYYRSPIRWTINTDFYPEYGYVDWNMDAADSFGWDSTAIAGYVPLSHSRPQSNRGTQRGAKATDEAL